MDHPIRQKHYKDLRKKLTNLLKSKYDLVRQNSIIFVCGGNESKHARTRFLQLASDRLAEYDLFTPESALKIPWQSSDGPFDLAEFEELIAAISFAVVLFPEAPGSFCETGYFAAKHPIGKKTLLAISDEFSGAQSFISTGPLHFFNKHSDFRPVQFTDYDGDFDDIIRKINASRPKSFRKAISVQKYNQLSKLEKLALIQEVISLLRMSTPEDIIFMMRSAFQSHISEQEIRSLIAILLGSGYLLINEPYAHLSINKNKPRFLDIRSGSKADETEVQFEIADLLASSPEFSDIFGSVHNAS